MTSPAMYGARALPVYWNLAGQVLTGGPDELGCYWNVHGVRGWRGMAKPRNRQTARPGGSGSYWGNAYRDAKVVTLNKVTVRCPTALVRVQVEDAIGQLLPDVDDVDLWPLTCIPENGVASTRYVGLDDEVDPIPKGKTWLEFDIQLVAPDPRRFGTWQTAVAGPPTDGSGGIVSTGTGIVSAGAGIGAGIAGQPAYATVAGGGAVPNPMVLELYAGSGAANVVLAEVTGASRVRYRGAIPAGASVFVNCDSQPAYQVPGCSAPIPGYRAVLAGSDATSAVTVTGPWPAATPGGSARYAVIAGDLSSDSQLRVHTRPCWD